MDLPTLEKAINAYNNKLQSARDVLEEETGMTPKAVQAAYELLKENERLKAEITNLSATIANIHTTIRPIADQMSHSATRWCDHVVLSSDRYKNTSILYSDWIKLIRIIYPDFTCGHLTEEEDNKETEEA